MNEKKCAYGGTLYSMGQREFRLRPKPWMFDGPAWLNTDTLELEISVCDVCKEVNFSCRRVESKNLWQKKRTPYRNAFSEHSEEDLHRITKNGNYRPEARDTALELLREKK